jgi:alpha-N-acetylglucosaminidase
MVKLLGDMDNLLASDEHFLLANWINQAKLKGTNENERDLYERNSRMQITLWGTAQTPIV